MWRICNNSKDADLEYDPKEYRNFMDEIKKKYKLK